MPDRPNDRALVACSLWLHIGFVGATALAARLLQLFGGEAKWPPAPALAFSGGVLAALSWRRARTVLENADRASAVTTVAPSELVSRPSTQHARRSTQEETLQRV